MSPRLHSIYTCYEPPDVDAPEVELEIFFTFLGAGQPMGRTSPPSQT
jgi:hypothetical protein